MATAEQRNHARNYLKKAEEYAGSAAANLAAGRYTPAAGDSIHAGICAKDAIVTVLTGSTRKAPTTPPQPRSYGERWVPDPPRRLLSALYASCSRSRVTSSTAPT